MAFYRQFVKAGDLVFDIGANVGNRTSVFLELGASTVAIEPQPAMARTLKIRFGHLEAFNHLPVALGRDIQIAEMSLATNHVTSTLSREFMTSMDFTGSDWNATTEVRVVRLRDVVNLYGQPSFCKIDVEGYEAEVLHGIGSSTPLPSLSFEFAPELRHRAHECVEILTAQANYRFRFSSGESMAWSGAWMAPADVHRDIESADAFGDFYAQQVTG